MTRTFEKIERNIKSGRGGKRPGSGRKKGSPNRLTSDLRQVILGALEAAGGERYLSKVAKDHPAAFLALLGKLLPLQHAGEIGGTLHVVERTVDAPPVETREEWLARRTKELGVSLTASARPELSAPMAKTIGMREVAANERRLPSGRTMIYALADPETLDVRYIGQTTSPGRRRWLHRSASNNRNPDRGVCRWISGLLSGGLAPVMMELEIVANGDDGETRWIAEYQSRGAKLLNMNSGGQTMEQCRRSARAITKGKRQTPLQRAFVLGKRSATEARAAFSEESAQRIDAKYRSALEAVKRAEHREGKHAARDRINQALLNRLPHVFGVGN